MKKFVVNEKIGITTNIPSDYHWIVGLLGFGLMDYWTIKFEID